MRLLGCIAVAALLLVGCGEDDSGDGSLALRISGEGPAKEGYPFVKDGVELAFAEGWTVTFDHVVASVGDLQVATTDGDVAHESPARYLAELTTGDPTVLTLDALTARRWDRLSMAVLPADDTSVNVNGVDAAIVDRMTSEGLTYYYRGQASRDGMTYDFEFGLRNPTRNTDCTNGEDSTQGVVVRNGSLTETEITIHLDHMFWDTLGSQQLVLRFDAIAAADLPEVGGDGDGLITFDELENQRLSDLRGLDGEPLVDAEGMPLTYNPASTPLSEPTLRGFILASTATQLHINGLGFCTIEAL